MWSFSLENEVRILNITKIKVHIVVKTQLRIFKNLTESNLYERTKLRGFKRNDVRFTINFHSVPFWKSPCADCLRGENKYCQPQEVSKVDRRWKLQIKVRPHLKISLNILQRHMSFLFSSLNGCVLSVWYPPVKMSKHGVVCNWLPA